MSTSAGSYRELGPLAEGGMASLSAAVDGEGAPVVIKRIRPELSYDAAYLQLFEDEGNVASRLDHPNIVRLLDRGEDDGGPFLVFERVEGTDLSCALDAHLREGRPMELACVLGVFIPLMRGMHAAHEAASDDGAPLALVHRDISPGNILLSEDGDVKLADFGVAKSALKTDETVAGEMKGKFAYMAPEQTHGGAIDRRADLFSAGIVLYECLTGRRLFDGPTDADVVRAVREVEPEDPSAHNPEVSEALLELLGSLLAKAPEDRPATAAAVADALYEVATGCCLETGLKRHVAQLARAYPRPTTPLPQASSSGPRRRTQKVISPELQGRPRRSGRGRVPLWVIAASVGVVGLATVFAFTVQQARPSAPPIVIERLPDSIVQDDSRQLRSLVVDGNAAEVPDLARGTGEPPATARSTPPHTTTAMAKPGARTKTSPPTRPAARPTSARTSAQVVKPATLEPAPGGFGKLFLSSKPWANVSIDGAALGSHTPLMGLRLPAGPHLISLENPHYNLKKTVRVVVPKGGEVRKQVDLTRR